MKSANIVTPEMAPPQALAACARELRELESYVAFDYEMAERLYGRADGKEVNPGKRVTNIEEARQLGHFCVDCQVLVTLGECRIRDRLQALSADQRSKFEKVDSGPATGSSTNWGFNKVEQEYRGSLGGGSPRNALQVPGIVHQ